MFSSYYNFHHFKKIEKCLHLFYILAIVFLSLDIIKTVTLSVAFEENFLVQPKFFLIHRRNPSPAPNRKELVLGFSAFNYDMLFFQHLLVFEIVKLFLPFFIFAYSFLRWYLIDYKLIIFLHRYLSLDVSVKHGIINF